MAKNKSATTALLELPVGGADTVSVMLEPTAREVSQTPTAWRFKLDSNTLSRGGVGVGEQLLQAESSGARPHLESERLAHADPDAAVRAELESDAPNSPDRPSVERLLRLTRQAAEAEHPLADAQARLDDLLRQNRGECLRHVCPPARSSTAPPSWRD